MKDSGIEWIGMIPEHWEIKRLKNVTNINMGQSPEQSSINHIEKGFPFLQGNSTFGKKHPIQHAWTTELKKQSQKNDILFSVRAPVGDINISDKKYGIGRGLCSITPTKINLLFLYYYLQVFYMEYLPYLKGSTFEAITVFNMRILKTVIASLNEQEAIASYLDKHVGNLDKYIDLATKKIKLLEEQKTALIYETVTRGLNPDVKMKDSGIEWIGMIPEHWEIKRVKDFFIKNKKSFHLANNDDNDGIFNFYTSGVKIKKSNTFDIEGTMLLLTTGGSFYSHYASGKFSYSTDVMALKSKNPQMEKFFYYYLKGVEKKYNDLFFYGTGLKHLKTKSFLSSSFIFPPQKEQEAIASYLDIKCSKIEKEIELLKKKVELLKEYKTSLIFEVVTGKKSVI
jgi:type I restriction enzyme S subunit